MNFSPSTTLDTISICLLSLQRICRNLSELLNTLDADVDFFERLLTQMTSSIHELSSSSTSSLNNDQAIDDFYERLCDEQLEPKTPRVTTL